jgi:hypothetical protein
MRENAFPKKKRKYTKGEKIKRLVDLEKEMDAGRMVFWIDTPKHPKFIVNMTLATIQTGLHYGHFTKAIRRQEATNG